MRTLALLSPSPCRLNFTPASLTMILHSPTHCMQMKPAPGDGVVCAGGDESSDEDDINFVGPGGKWEFLGKPTKTTTRRKYYDVGCAERERLLLYRPSSRALRAAPAAAVTAAAAAAAAAVEALLWPPKSALRQNPTAAKRIPWALLTLSTLTHFARSSFAYLPGWLSACLLG